MASRAQIATLPKPEGFNNSLNGGGRYAAVDSTGHRIYWMQDSTNPFACDSRLFVLSTEHLTWQALPVPCIDPGQGFAVQGIFVDGPAKKLYVIGQPNAEFLANQYMTYKPKQTAIVRQLDADTLGLDWSADISSSCDWFALNGPGSGVLARSGDNVIVYCYQGGTVESRGQSVVIPLQNNRPRTRPDGSVETRTAPIFASPVQPYIDPTSGRILVSTIRPPFGPAIWVFDALRERFVGVIPTGASIEAAQREGWAGAVDARIGRAYIHDSRGLVTADVRHTPLPGGVSWKVLVGDAINTQYIPMATDGNRRELYVPIPREKRFAVVADRSPPPAKVLPEDADAGTADIPELAGLTARAFSGSSTAFGSHILNTGGIPAALGGAIRGADCNPVEPDRCITSTVLSPGTREYFLSQTYADVGSNTGSTAFATGGRAAPNDRATDNDARSVGRCLSDKLDAADPRLSGPAQAALEEQCGTPNIAKALFEDSGPLDGFAIEDFRQGTSAGEFPVASTYCSDFGGSAKQDSTEEPTPVAGVSSVKCDADSKVTHADASAGPSSLDLGGVPLRIGRTESSIVTRLGTTGTESVATAIARDIRLGEFSIGKVVTTARSTAHGRTGTTTVALESSVFGASGPNLDCREKCDGATLASAINAAFGGRIRAYPPRARLLASPRGYTAAISKDPEALASDRAVNDDETVTVNGLDIVFYNDSFYSQVTANGNLPRGNRSRLVIGLAGVAAEAHYGIFPASSGIEGGGITTGSDGRADVADLTLSGVGGRSGTETQIASRHTGQGRSRGQQTPLAALVDAFRFAVNSPAKAALLLLLGVFLLAPVYFAIRRRVFIQGVNPD